MSLQNAPDTIRGRPDGRSDSIELQVQFSSNATGDIPHARLRPNANSASSSSGSAFSDTGPHMLPAEPFKTVLCFLLMAFVLACNLFFTGVIHDRTPTVLHSRSGELQHPLRDIVRDTSARLHINKYQYTLLTVSEIVLVCTTSFVVLVLCFHEHRSIVFRRWFFLLALLYAVRLISMNVTMLPVSSETLFTRCDAKSPGFSGGAIVSRFLELVASCGLANVKYCGNYVYSGHTVTLVLNCLLVGEYCPAWILSVPLKALSICGIAMILMSEYDYTISVITAYYITTRLFWVYHTFANNAPLKNVHHFEVNQICKVWWYPIFRYLEGNVKTVVPAMRPSFVR